jgi:hypothetical protein
VGECGVFVQMCMDVGMYIYIYGGGAGDAAR